MRGRFAILLVLAACLAPSVAPSIAYGNGDTIDPALDRIRGDARHPGSMPLPDRTPRPWDGGQILHQTPDRTVWTDGRSAQHYGPFSIFNDGTMAPRLGDRPADLTLFPNGKVCSQIASHTFCH